jgi:hypothetical protein
MNDFSEIESELRKLRPVQPSAKLVARIEHELATGGSADEISDNIIRPDRFRGNWRAAGLGLAAAAILVFLLRVNFPAAPQTAGPSGSSPVPAIIKAPASAQFIPAGATQVLYNKRDEGLHYADGSAEPVRRVRSRTRETLRWHNPQTGASLRISYPTEQVELIPVSGQ